MILADIQTSILLGLAVFGFFGGLVFYGGLFLLGKLGRSVRDSYEKGGGNRQLVKNIATKGAGQILKRLIFKR
jgi:hypothetical protein